ncbi:Hypothetical predicted protein, partial [Prunus dulcis]
IYSSYALRFGVLIGFVASDRDIILITLNWLPGEFNNFKSYIRARPVSVTISELRESDLNRAASIMNTPLLTAMMAKTMLTPVHQTQGSPYSQDQSYQHPTPDHSYSNSTSGYNGSSSNRQWNSRGGSRGNRPIFLSTWLPGGHYGNSGGSGFQHPGSFLAHQSVPHSQYYVPPHSGPGILGSSTICPTASLWQSPTP